MIMMNESVYVMGGTKMMTPESTTEESIKLCERVIIGKLLENSKTASITYSNLMNLYWE